MPITTTPDHLLVRDSIREGSNFLPDSDAFATMQPMQNAKLLTAFPRVQSSLRPALIAGCALLALWGLGYSGWRIATEGPGVMGVNNAVPWGWDIVQFVFWIGLGHAGTLISAILLLTRQRWRLEIARHAELMTLCAVITAAIFPLVHVGRIWMIWTLSPLPVASGVWPDLASPLVWDALAVSSYLLLSFLYWRAGIMGEHLPEGRQKARWGRCCQLMAGVLTPLVVTVHSVVGSDFAVALRWNSPLLPPYFVCGALLSGMAAVLLIGLVKGVSETTREKLARLLLAMGMSMGLFYGLELAHSPHLLDQHYAAMLALNVGAPALLWLPPLRRTPWSCALVATAVLLGMWLEREQIIVGRSIAITGGHYTPSTVDIAMLLGSIGLFLGLYLLLAKGMPEDHQDPLDAAQQAPPGQGTLALLGASAGVSIVLLWGQLTQWQDLAGTLHGNTGGPTYHLPALLVAGLLGAGLTLFLNLLYHLRHHA